MSATPTELRTMAGLLADAAVEIETALTARDNATMGREGQLRNTLAFMAEADALQNCIDRAINVLDPRPEMSAPSLLRLVREARSILVRAGVPSAAPPEARQGLPDTPDVVADPPAPEPPPNAPRAAPGGWL